MLEMKINKKKEKEKWKGMLQIMLNNISGLNFCFPLWIHDIIECLYIWFDYSFV